MSDSAMLRQLENNPSSNLAKCDGNSAHTRFVHSANASAPIRETFGGILMEMAFVQFRNVPAATLLTLFPPNLFGTSRCMGVSPFCVSLASPSNSAENNPAVYSNPSSVPASRRHPPVPSNVATATASAATIRRPKQSRIPFIVQPSSLPSG